MKPKAFPFICFFFVFIHTLPVSNLLALPKEKRLVIFENGKAKWGLAHKILNLLDFYTIIQKRV